MYYLSVVISCMTVRKNQSSQSGIYFITYTCYNWLPLFDIADSYNEIYKQLAILKREGHKINGYVIMPNHVHLLINFNCDDYASGFINKRIGAMKRFLAYSIVESLKQKNCISVLEKLEHGVSSLEQERNKKHQIFEPSFDCKYCYSEEMILAKLDYMHRNPIKGKWNLAADQISYGHSSAQFYLTGKQGLYSVDHYLE